MAGRVPSRVDYHSGNYSWHTATLHLLSHCRHAASPSPVHAYPHMAALEGQGEGQHVHPVTYPGSGQLGISGADRVGLVIWVASVEAAPASGLHGDKFLTQGAQREAPRDEQLGVCVPGQPHAGCPLCPLVLSCLNVSLADHELAPAWPGLQMEQLVP